MKRDRNQDLQGGARTKPREPAAQDRPQGTGLSVLQAVDDLPDLPLVDGTREDRGAPGMVDAGGGVPARKARWA